MGAVGLEHPGGGVGGVAHLGGGADDALPGLAADVLLAVERLADGGDGDTALLRNVFHRYHSAPPPENHLIVYVS